MLEGAIKSVFIRRMVTSDSIKVVNASESPIHHSAVSKSREDNDLHVVIKVNMSASSR